MNQGDLVPFWAFLCLSAGSRWRGKESKEQSIKVLSIFFFFFGRTMLNLSFAIDTSRKNINPLEGLTNISFYSQLAVLTIFLLRQIGQVPLHL